MPCRPLGRRPDALARHRSIALALVLAAAPALLAACSSAGGKEASSNTTTSATTPKPRHYPAQVALFGDSLAWEAQPYYSADIHEDKEAALEYDTFGGTATCDWLNRMRQVEAQIHPKAVELEFSGNNLSACMKGYDLYTPAYYQKYRDDTLTAIGIFSSGDTHIYLVGAPITKKQLSVPNWRTLNNTYQAIAQADPSRVTYVNAGPAVEGPGGTFTQTLPCITGQPCIGPTVNGTKSNIVRAPDGTHFCPTKSGDVHGVIGGCPVYSMGAYLFAKAMTEPLAVTSSSSSSSSS
jgi:hypothetical protein